MAESNGEDDNPYSFGNFDLRKESKSDEDSAPSENSNVKPDLGIGSQHDSEKRGSSDNTSSGNDAPKREENPFSFKHFLKRDSGSNYQNTGARPKVYNHVPVENIDRSDLDMDLESNVYGRSGTSRHVGTPELTSVLPDFVQDHLVVEQCYLNHSDNCNAPQLTVDLENLPDFAISNILPAQEPNPSKSGCKIRPWEEPKNSSDNDEVAKDIPFDLTGSTRSQNFPGKIRKNSGVVPLDLPTVDTEVNNSARVNGGLPFDLPLVHDVDVAAQSLPPGARSGPSLGEVGVSKSLPDFLSDGPIHSGRHSDEAVESMPNIGNGSGRLQSSEEEMQRLQVENERLRRELDASRRQLSEQFRRIQCLEKEVHTMRSKEHEESANLEKAIEQVEDNLKRTTRRAVFAETQVSKLKQERKVMLNEMAELQRENLELRTGQGFPARIEPDQELTQRLANDLKAAAGTAEMSLRQLLTGVENLRVIAATMESMHRIHDRTGDFMPDDDDVEGAAAAGTSRAGPL